MAYFPQTTQRFVPVTGGTVTILPTDSVTTVIIEPAGALATLTIAFPTGQEGAIINVVSTQILTAITQTTATGTIFSALTTLALGGTASYVWNTSQTKWYKIK